jgi:hypothetical protein
LSGSACAMSSCGGPQDEIEVPTNSVATIGDFGSSKSIRKSLAKNEWMSPLNTTRI